jgi:penicillin amidase/acyl-homoserine-lactone acylase
MRAFKITLLTLAGIVIAALLFCTYVIVADRLSQPASPNLDAFIIKARGYNARIRRDTYGVPHIFGRRDADAAFGLAFAHCEDDFRTIQQVALATRGQLAAAEGPKAAVADYMVHLLRVWETVNAKYDSDLPSDVRQVLEAYADGVNYYAAMNPDRVIRGVLPLTGKDVAAGFVFKSPFFYGLDSTLLKLAAPAKKEGARLWPSVLPQSSPLADGDNTMDLSLSREGENAFLITHDALPVGSNGVAVGPGRSTDGATRLLVNSHQPYTGPVSWYEAVLESGEGWHVAGGFFPGSPFMLHGHNQHLGWANTVDSPHLIDIYKLTVNPANPNQYKLDGQWRDFEKSDAKMRVKIWGPLIWTVHREVLYSAHGPVLKTDHGVFAIRYAGIGDVREPLQYFRLNKASNLAEWRAAMQLQSIPSLNFIYADEKANIGYIYNGLFPVRIEEPGLDWQDAVPGDRLELIWHQYLPFDKVPQIWNPHGGLVFNSNNTPFHAAANGDDLKQQDFSAAMGIQHNMTNRAWRAMETFGADEKISPEKFREYKFDLAYSEHSEVVQLVDQAIALSGEAAGQESAADDLRKAHEILKRWDHRTDGGNKSTALAVFTAEPVLRARTLIKGEPQPATNEQILSSLREAIKTLKKNFHHLDPEWGQVNRLHRGKFDLPIDGGPDIYRAVYGIRQPDGRLTAAGGDTFIMFVTWDKDGHLFSESIHQFGSATLDENSRHYADQAMPFVLMKTKPVWFTEQQLAGHVEADYHLGDTRSVMNTRKTASILHNPATSLPALTFE